MKGVGLEVQRNERKGYNLYFCGPNESRTLLITGAKEKLRGFIQGLSFASNLKHSTLSGLVAVDMGASL